MESVLENLSKIANLPRHLISDGYDEGMAIIEKIAREKGLTFKLHAYPTGHDCGTWIIPEKWTLIRAQLKDSSGNVLIDSDIDPMACMSYSLPFEGVVPRDELKKHLYTCSYQPEATPFIFKYYKRDWGLCCSQTLKEGLDDDEYVVSIQTKFSDGHLKVGEIIVEGEVEESFVIASHLCHPYMVNDGPIGVFPTMEILERLKADGAYYTFRQLIVPENIGSAAWLSSNADLIPKLRGGLFVEMIGTDLPLRLHRSFRGDTLVDRMFEEVVRERSESAEIDDFIYANDERQFNGPGVDIPMLGLNRSWMSRYQTVNRAFPYYHTNLDTIGNIHMANLAESVEILEELIQVFDRYAVRAKPLFVGEPFLHRFGAHIDAFEEKDEKMFVGKLAQSTMLMDVLFKCGHGLTVHEISHDLDVPAKTVRSILDRFEKLGLVSFLPI
jgi:aminopeptidase-like protein